MIIKGNTVGTTMPRSNLNQKNQKAADYVVGSDEWLSAINKAQSTADTAVKNASAANTAAGKAQTTGDTALSNANRAQAAADKAQSTANTANEAAGKAQNTADSAHNAASFARVAAQNAQLTADSKVAKITGAVVLAAGKWVDNRQVVSYDGVTKDNAVITSPAASSRAIYAEAQVYCSAQDSNSLTFICQYVPKEDITVNVLVLDESAPGENDKEIVDSNCAPAIVDIAAGEFVAVRDSMNKQLRGLKLYGKTTQNGTPTPEAPVSLDNVGKSGSVTVNVSGKNLLWQASSNWMSEENTNGITYTYVRDSDGNLLYINADGTATEEANSHCKKAFTTLPPGTYIVTGCPSGYGSGVSLRIGKGADSVFLAVQEGSGYTLTLTEETIISINITIGKGKTISNVKFYPMIRLASVKNDVYEPYVRKDITALTPGGLPGIPVSSGGNYTDANGQQWICDEVDLERGVYVQRIGKFTYIGSSSEAWGKSTGTAADRFYKQHSIYSKMLPIMTNMFRCVHEPQYTLGVCFLTYNTSNGGYYIEVIAAKNGTFDTLSWRKYLETHPLEVQYVLPEEKETPLSKIDPDALTQYTALHTHYPNTTVRNDAGAGMEVKYVADTKLYIDKKVDELAAALVNNA